MNGSITMLLAKHEAMKKHDARNMITDGRTLEWADGRAHGRMDGRMDGRTEHTGTYRNKYSKTHEDT